LSRLIVKNRLTNDERTRAYRDAHLAKGWTKKAVYRALKRAVAREVFAALVGRCAGPDYTDLRPARRAKNITLTAVATALNVWPARVGELELGHAATTASPIGTQPDSPPLDNA
jgi:transposase